MKLKPKLWMREQKKVLMALLLVSSLVGLVAPLPLSLGLAQEVQTPGMKVERIQIVGNKLITTAEILKEIQFEEGELVTEEGIKEGGERILKMGYFQRVIPNYNRLNEGIEVIYQVEENPVVKEIEVEGNERYGRPLEIFGLKIPFTSPILSTERILEILEENGVEKGKILNVNELSRALEAILEEYQKKGYTLVRVGDVKIGPKLVIELIESKIERIEIRGVSPKLEEIARSLIKLPLDKPVKIRALQLSIQGLNSSIYFEPTGPQDISFSPGSAPDKVVLQWALRERRFLEGPTPIREIRFTGNTVYPQERLLEALGPLPEGGELDNFQLLQALQGVYDLYRQDGYTLADLANAGVEDGVLTVEVLEGMIDEILIEGNERTKEYVIRRKLTLHPGEVFNEELLRTSYVGLQELGYFKDIDIGFEEVAPGHVKLIITVMEKKNLGSLNGALSYAKGGLVGKLSLSWKNIFGTGQDISLGYDRGLIGKAHTNWHFDYSTSVLFPNYDFFKFSLYHKAERGEEKGGGGQYLIKRVGGELSLGYPLGARATLTLKDRYERFQRCPQLEGECEPPGVTNSITLGLSQDTRDDAIFPTSGGLKDILLEQAGGFTPGVRFTKLRVSLVEHFPAGKDQALAVRALSELGLSLPAQERFTLGGVSTIRGFPPFRTDRLSLINAEYRVKLTEGVVGVVFADMGVGNKGLKMEVGWAFGLEMRVTVPAIGLVRFIFAWPCVDGRVEWAPKFEFGLGPMF